MHSLNAAQVRWILIDLFVLIVSIALHEFGHAIMADLLGDDTPRRQGRVTLNPLVHADPIGTYLLPIVGGVLTASGAPVGGFGWGKPVQWNPSRVSRKFSMGTAKVLVSIAGPMMNVLLGVVIALVHTILLSRHAIDPAGQPSLILLFAVETNFVLFFFNLIPAPPLDGGHVLEELMPYKHRRQFESYARFGPFIILAIIAIPQLARIFTIPADFCAGHVYSVLGRLFGM